MKAEITGKQIIITLDLQEPKASASGKSYVIAGTGGFAKTSLEHEGKPVSVSVNVTIPNDLPYTLVS